MSKPNFETTVATKDHIKPALEKLSTAFGRSFPDKKLKGKEAKIEFTIWRGAPEPQMVSLTGEIEKDRESISGFILEQEAAIAKHAKSYPLRLGLSIQVTP
jgi:hypothetical protein